MTDPTAEGIQKRYLRSMTGRTVWLAASKSFAYALNLGIPLILVRRMSREEYGTYLQAFQIITTAIMLLPLGFGMTAYYFLPREREARGRVIQNILLVLGVLGGIALAVFAFLPDTAYRLTGNPVVSTYGLLIGLVIFFWIWSGFLETAVLANEEAVLAPVFVVVSQVIRTSLMLAAALWNAELRSLLLASLAHGVVQTLVMFWYLASRFPGFWRGFDKTLLRRQFVYASPFFLSTFLWAIQSDVHAFFVSKGFGEERFAIYRVACFQLPFVNLLMESVNAVLIPRVVELQHANRMQELRALLLRVVRLQTIAFFPLYIALLVLSREFITGLFTAKYAESAALFAIFLTMLPWNIVTFDSVSRAFPSLATFLLRLRMFVAPALIASLWIGVRVFDLWGIVLLTVGFALFERTVYAVRTAQTIQISRADSYAMRDLSKIVLASLLAALPTLVTRQLMSGVRPLIVFFAAGAVYYLSFIALAWWMKVPTAAEKDTLRMWYQRLLRLKPA